MISIWRKGVMSKVTHGQGDREKTLVSDFESQSIMIIGRFQRFALLSVMTLGKPLPNSGLDLSRRR